VLSLEGVSVRYPGADRPSLVDASLDVPDGSITAIAGASESGKTTLCLVLAGLVPRVVRASVSGTLRIDGDDVADQPMHALAGRIGILTGAPDASLSLVADTVYEEVAFGPVNLGLPRDEVMRRVGSALATVGLDDIAERDPRRLSTGQTQLVAIAGLLAMGAGNLLLDEPFAHLDPRAMERFVAVLRRLADGGAAILVASQDTRLLSAVADRAAVLDGGRLDPVSPAHDVLRDPRIAAAGLEPIAALARDP
jgi:energy-coupling factor transporter ATP-binding protein EcfA2